MLFSCVLVTKVDFLNWGDPCELGTTTDQPCTGVLNPLQSHYLRVRDPIR